MANNTPITLVVMAAGMGSRFGGLKQMEPVASGDRVLLDFSVYDAVGAGFDKVVFVIKHEIDEPFRRLVGDRIARSVRVEYVYQELDELPRGFVCPEGREKPWGTAQAILACRDAVKEPFAVVNADDYYGADAFYKMAEFLREDTDEYAMVGYRLANTLTENGYVSRGVCRVEDGYLSEIRERTRIGSDCRYTEDGGETFVTISPDAVVSMNLWGLRPDVFASIEEGFCRFLAERGREMKSEYYLPTVLSELIDNGNRRVRVLTAADKWYGVTYKEDKPEVVAAIAAMIKAGKYPEG